MISLMTVYSLTIQVGLEPDGPSFEGEFPEASIDRLSPLNLVLEVHSYPSRGETPQ